MSKILFGAVVAQARNKIGGVVFSTNTYGAFIRKKTSPGAAKTAASTKSTMGLSATAKAWNGKLTDTERQSWITLATATVVYDIFHTAQHLSGIAMFIRVNKELKILGATDEGQSPYSLPALLYWAPADQIAFDIAGITATYSAGPPWTMTVTPTNTPTGADQLVVCASNFISAGRKAPKPAKIPIVQVFPTGHTAPFDFSQYWQAKHLMLHPFSRVAVAAYALRGTNGAAGPRYSTVLSIA